MAVGAIVSRRRGLAAAGAAAVLVLGAGMELLTHGGGRGEAVVSRTPVPIISVIPTPVPAPTPTPERHDGLRIAIPELGIDLPIVEGDGYNAPLYQAAHYPGTSWPGHGGRSVIYAHARAGMFGPLFGARVGEHVRVTGPDGTTWTYALTEYYPHWP